MAKSHKTLMVILLSACIFLAAIGAGHANQPALSQDLKIRESTFGEAIGTSKLLQAAAPIGPVQYVVIDVMPAAGNQRSKGYGINNLSQVVGRSYDWDTTNQEVVNMRGFIWELNSGSRLLPTLSGESGAWGISDTGQVCGFSDNAGGYQRAVRWDLQSDTIQDLGTLANPVSGQSGNESYAYGGINNQGLVVGHAEIPNEAGTYTPFHGFLYDDSNGMQDLGTFADDPDYQDGYSIAYDITEQEQVVGIAHTQTWALVAFFYDAVNGLQQLAVDPGASTGEWYATCINEDGLIGGTLIMSSANQSFPYYWTDKSAVPVEIVLPSTYPYGEIYSVNESDQLVGVMWDANDQEHAFLFDTVNGLQDLNDQIDAAAGWTLNAAIDINDLGQIAGFGEVNGETRAFLLTPSGDQDGDGDVDGEEMALLAQNFGATGCNNCTYDLNKDTVADGMDLALSAMLLGQ